MSLLFFGYILFAVLNFAVFIKGQTNWLLVGATFGYLLIVLASSDYQNQHDIISYIAQFEQYDAFDNENFSLYYVFFSLMGLGQFLGMSFLSWWMMISALIFVNFIISLKIHNYNPNAFVFFFLIYYFITLYTGLKALLGLSIFFIGVGFLFKGQKYGKLIFTLFTLLAGGCHSMFYFYLILLLSDICKDPDAMILFFSRRNLLYFLIAISIVVSVFLRASGSAQHYLASIFAFIESDKVEGYFELETKMGFFIPVIMQLLSMLLAYKAYKEAESMETDHFVMKGNLFHANLMNVLYYPLFMISLTFMRLITSFSLVTISASFYDAENVDEYDRKRILGYALLVILGFYYRKFVIGNMWVTSIVPLFNL